MGAQGNKGVLTELDVRIWMRDNDPESNHLLDDYEFTPEEVRTAMTLTVDFFNEQPPLIGNWDLDNFPFRGALLRGTGANLLFIAAHRYRRNALKYNVTGGAVADQEKALEYEQAGQRLWDGYKEWVTSVKRSINAEQAWGTVSVPPPGWWWY